MNIKTLFVFIFLILIFGCKNPVATENKVPGTIIFSDSFNDPLFKDWRTSNDPSTPSLPDYAIQITSAQKRLGNSSVKFELHNNDPEQYSGKRAELRRWPPDEQFAERWFAFSIFLPENYETDPKSAEIVAQWHNYPDLNLGEQWTSPPLCLLTKNGNWFVVIIWDDNKISDMEEITLNNKQIIVDLGSYENDKNKWIDWVFHVKWGWLDSHKPVLEIFKDGKLVYSRKGPNTTNDETGVYFNIGIYKWDWLTNPQKSVLTERTIFIDEVKIGDANCSLSDFYPVH